jgi:SAM-dependent methyltransferase
MRIEGFIDGIEHDRIDGWVYNPEQPDWHCSITTRRAAESIGIAKANQYRADLEEAGIGGGDHAFAIHLMKGITEAELDQISLSVVCADGSLTDLPVDSQRWRETRPNIASQTLYSPLLDRHLKSLIRSGSSFAEAGQLGKPQKPVSSIIGSADFVNDDNLQYYLNRISVDVATMSAAALTDVWPIPNTADREDYAPDYDLIYWLSGYTDYILLQRKAHRYGIMGGRYFDFGGSTGRVYRNFAIQNHAWEIWASDFKKESINFSNTYLPENIRAFVNSSFPHLPLEDKYFDLITACSVFTHIDETEISWLLELRRILRIGGIAMISVHNDDTWRALLAPSWLSDAISTLRPDLSNQTEIPEGRTVLSFRDDDPYHCNVFHSNSYLRAAWGRFFKILEIVPKFLGEQAIVVCERIA